VCVRVHLCVGVGRCVVITNKTILKTIYGSILGSIITASLLLHYHLVLLLVSKHSETSFDYILFN